MKDTISTLARTELTERLATGAELSNLKLVKHQPFTVLHGKLVRGIDLSRLIEGAGALGFSNRTVSTQHYGIFLPGTDFSSENALGLTSITTVHKVRILTAARNAPPTVTTAITDGSDERNATFGWIEENVQFGSLKKAGIDTHGHTFFPHLVMRLQSLVGNLPLAYYPSQPEEEITSLMHQDFEKVVGLRRVFLLLYLAQLADKKWLVTRQADETNYLFAHYQTLPQAVRQAKLVV